MRCRRAAPAHRLLQVFTFDPAVALDLDTALIAHTSLSVPWEDLEPGPVGEYVEVVDRDPASECFYLPVDLDHPHLLAMDGLEPTEGDPQFHQQMVYAVVMATISNFERALGRKVLWSERRGGNFPHDGLQNKDRFIRRLRCYPHALREANAYYSPEKKALLFGYFRAGEKAAADMLPGSFVFTCLSHDIVAHETTHAILDGLHPRFIEDSNIDVLAFHEAFADVVALLQHFTFPEVIRHQIAKTRGDLGRVNLLADLAREFGRAIGERRSLRSGLDKGELKLDPEMTEPHDRGAVLVAAVFEALVTMYRTRTADLLRLAHGDSSRTPDHELHPDLINRMVSEMARVAQHMLTMCIRALDYCPPVDITFAEYLRALITADVDLAPPEGNSYRLALIAAFRRRYIFPEECRSLSADSLVWQKPRHFTRIPPQRFKQFDVRLVNDRALSFERSKRNAGLMHGVLQNLFDGAASTESRLNLEKELGLALDPATAPQSIRRKEGRVVYEIHSVRVARRILADGSARADLVIEIIQGRAGYLDVARQAEVDKGNATASDGYDFRFRGGCTLIVDVATGEVRYVIRKRITSEARLAAQRRYIGRRQTVGSTGVTGSDHGPEEGLAKTYFEHGILDTVLEPFAMIHRHKA